ncbi:MAG TPA: RodZ domain-containing protein [Gaiellaceae bacterium]|nr:RodZ domain-containing protein [Gaiellaceae bacterium]
MFEIGNSLREARLRQGYELPRVEADTKIRAKYLRALEEEKFAVLPGETYVKGFLRTYAEYLGLDGQLYVDEFNSRFTRDDEPLVPERPRRQAVRSRAVESNFVIVALAGIIAVTILVVVAWKFGSSGAEPQSNLLPGPATTSEATTSTREKTPNKPAHQHAKRKTKLVLTAVDGDCWVQVRERSATGRLIYEGTLQAGQRQRFSDEKRLWLQLGNPVYLSAKLNGQAVENLPNGPAIVVATAKGVRTVSTA